MRETGTRRRSSVRTGVVLLALASLGVLLFALTPTANAGLAGSNQLVVQLNGTGGGNVTQFSGPGTGTPAAINCSSAGGGAPSTGVCVAQVPFGVPPAPYVGLQANPPNGSEFIGWQVSPASTATFGCGQQVQCFVQVGAAVTVRATFNQAPGFPLTVIKQGPAASSGTVTSNPAGINCGSDCTGSFPQGTIVTLTAAPGPGTTFGGWGGSCAGSGSNLVCQVSVIQVTAVTATFNVATFALSVSITGDGGVSSNIQPGIECQTGNAAGGTGSCSANFASGTQVVLTASADSGSTFNGWSGACASSGTNPTCNVTVSQAQSVTATFAQAAVQASVTGNRVIYSTRRPQRVLRITVSAQQDVSVRIQLQRGGTNWASKRFANVDEGSSVLTLNIRNGIPAGRYQAVVTFTAQGAPPLVQNRNVKLKAVPG